MRDSRRFARVAGQYLLVVAAALVLNFVLPRLAPGDAVDYLVPPQSGTITAEQRAAVLDRYDLSGSMATQFVTYLRGLSQGDLGVSVRTGQPVRAVIGARLLPTVLLVGGAVVASTIIGVLLGYAAGWRRGTSRDVGLLTGVLFVDALPAFFVGLLLLLVFSVNLGWFPIYGAVVAQSRTGIALVTDTLKRLALPLATLTLVGIASVFVVARAALINETQEGYVLLGRAKGLSERQVRRQARRNALLPVSTASLLGFSTLVGAATVVETVFSYPGLGSLAFDSVLARDFPVLQAVFLILALIAIAANLVNDLISPLLDPRISRLGAARMRAKT